MANEPLSDKTKALVRETAHLFKMLFVGRTDAYAIYAPFSEGSKTSGTWLCKKEPLKMGHISQHLLGERCVGTYMLTPDSTVRAIVFDIDLKPEVLKRGSKEPIGAPYFLIGDDETLDLEQQRGNVEAALHRPDDPAHRWACSLVRSTVAFIQRATFDVLGLTSTAIVTGGGAHVIVPFGHEVPAAEARSAAHSVMASLPIFGRKSESFYVNNELPEQVNLEIEVFPKQDELTDPTSFGNLVRLPFGWHHDAGIRTYALDPALPTHPSWRLPKTSSIDALRLQANSLDLKWELSDS